MSGSAHPDPGKPKCTRKSEAEDDIQEVYTNNVSNGVFEGRK